MVIKVVVTFIYFSWPKCFAVGDAINMCLLLEEATVLHCKRCQPRVQAPVLGTEHVGRQLSGTKRGRGVCPSMSLPWEGWVLLLRKKPWWTGWKMLLECKGDSMQKHLLMQQRKKCLFQASSSCFTSALPFLPLLSAAEASPLWGPCVQCHPTCSEALGCLWAQHTPWRKAGKGKNRKNAALGTFVVM